ncbi:hydrogenase maturation nickel metallochaperone HypA [Kitasatospora sp. LaBMicrA B282]|uniref:hydrogenase maturation nickel metallochaperone HypA n=1 Tax=Kitasatospora sp. LaBMicrA B282 TaxID=3420949 RepID=UPI003D09FE26
MSIAVAVLEQVEQAAREHGAGGVAEIRLRIGELAGVVPQALDFCFELACAETVAEGARLSVEAVEARASCAGCAMEWAVGMPPDLGCPRCPGVAGELLTGRELQILDVRWADAPAPVRADQEG